MTDVLTPFSSVIPFPSSPSRRSSRTRKSSSTTFVAWDDEPSRGGKMSLCDPTSWSEMPLICLSWGATTLTKPVMRA